MTKEAIMKAFTEESIQKVACLQAVLIAWFFF